MCSQEANGKQLAGGGNLLKFLQRFADLSQVERVRDKLMANAKRNDEAKPIPTSVLSVCQILLLIQCYGLAMVLPFLLVGMFVGPRTLLAGVIHGAAGLTAGWIRRSLLRGRNWAKWLLHGLCFTALVVLSWTLGVMIGNKEPPSSYGILIVFVLLDVATLVYLLHPDTTRFLSRRERAGSPALTAASDRQDDHRPGLG